MVYDNKDTSKKFMHVVITAPRMTWLGFIVRSALCSGHGCEYYIHTLANLNSLQCAAALSVNDDKQLAIFLTSWAAATKSIKVRFSAWQEQASADNRRNAATFILIFSWHGGGAQLISHSSLPHARTRYMLWISSGITYPCTLDWVVQENHVHLPADSHS